MVLEVEELADAVGRVDGDGGLALGVALLDAVGPPGVGGSSFSATQALNFMALPMVSMSLTPG